MRTLAIAFALIFCTQSFADSVYQRNIAFPKYKVTTSIKVFIDEYGTPYNAVIVTTSYSKKADKNALNQAMTSGYEPIRGSQGERLSGWYIVDFHNTP